MRYAPEIISTAEKQMAIFFVCGFMSASYHNSVQFWTFHLDVRQWLQSRRLLMSAKRIMLKHDNSPEWHYLETDGTYIDIVIDRKIFLNMIGELKATAQIITSSTSVLLGSKFVMPKENADWGFGSRLIFIENKNEWLRYRLNLVKMVEEPNRSIIAAEIQCSLQLLFTMLYIFGKTSSRGSMQIGEISSIATKDEFAHSYLAATFSPLATNLFTADPEGILSGIQSTMKIAYGILFPMDREIDDYSLRVHFSNGYPGFMVPGNCACLGVSCPPSQPDITEGFELSTHNHDTVIQQLTTLVGIAKLMQNLRTQTAPQ